MQRQGKVDTRISIQVCTQASIIIGNGFTSFSFTQQLKSQRLTHSPVSHRPGETPNTTPETLGVQGVTGDAGKTLLPREPREREECPRLEGLSLPFPRGFGQEALFGSLDPKSHRERRARRASLEI